MVWSAIKFWGKIALATAKNCTPNHMVSYTNYNEGFFT